MPTRFGMHCTVIIGDPFLGGTLRPRDDQTIMSYLDDPVFRCVEGIRAPGEVARHLAVAWAEWDGEVPDEVAVEAERTEYEPFKGATMVADASVVPGRAEGRAVNLGILLRVYPDAEQLLRAERQAKGQRSGDTEAPPFFTIPSCRAAAWTFRGPSELLQRSKSRDQATIAGRVDDTGSEYTGGCEGLPPWLARYSPPEGAEVEDRASHDARIAVKVLEAGDAARACDNHRLLAGARKEGHLDFCVPELLSADAERSAMVLRDPAGCVFTAYLREPFREPFEKVGRALASLHRSSISAREGQSRAAVVDEAVRASRRIARAMPELGDSVSEVAEGLLLGCRPSVVSGHSPIHGGIDGDCILLDGPTVGIRHWDGLAMGHPHEDLSALIAHVIDESAGCQTPAGVTRACIRALIESYEEAVGQPIARAELSWHLSRALIVRAGDSLLAGLASGWQDRLIALVSEAQALQSSRSRYVRGC